jgi:hypothetical protein
MMLSYTDCDTTWVSPGAASAESILIKGAEGMWFIWLRSVIGLEVFTGSDSCCRGIDEGGSCLRVELAGSDEEDEDIRVAVGDAPP